MSLSARSRQFHFVGIGGIGMSGLAELLLKLGHRVSGSDLSANDSVRRLQDLGAVVQIGHSEDILVTIPPDVLVYSSAVDHSNPELQFAKKHFIPIIRRAEMLAELMRMKRGAAVAGSHGKTTTTGILSLMLREGGLDPTVVIGGRFDALGSNAALGAGAWLVAESDESDGSFLRLTPEIAIVTNIDREHLDHYGSFERTLHAFADFIDRVPFYGKAILSRDCPHLRSLASQIQKPHVWYGLDGSLEPDYWIEVLHRGREQKFVIRRKADLYEKPFIEAVLSVPGVHNVCNATAALIAAHEIGVDLKSIQRGLELFQGVKRRFEKKGLLGDHVVIEDYAHHPTEIRATIAAARDCFGCEPFVMFQPHRYSRTRDSWEEFRSCFEGACEVWTSEIYASSEKKEDWTRAFDREFFAQNIQGPPAHFFSSFEDMAETFLNKKLVELKAETPILILGAGNLASQLVPRLMDFSAGS